MLNLNQTIEKKTEVVRRVGVERRFSPDAHLLEKTFSQVLADIPAPQAVSL